MSSAEIIISILCAIIGSNGVWLIISKLLEKRDSTRQMLVGLGHDRIISLCKEYIERGSLTAAEYENLVDYLFKPYSLIGGNGSAERMVEEVKKLPIKEFKED